MAACKPRSNGCAPSPRPSFARSPPSTRPIFRAFPAAATPAGAGGAVEHPAVEPWPGDRVEPWSKIRKITADHMVMSRRVSAHVASFFEVDFTRVAQLRGKAKQSYGERGVKSTSKKL